MRSLALLAALLVALPAAAPGAAAFTAENGLIVNRGAAGGFEVPWRGSARVTSFWCAAGDYVIRGLRMSPSTRIWRVSEPPRRAGEAITFALTPEGAARRSGLLILLGPENGVTAAHAASFCEFDAQRR
ncbi:hypothetical protein [Albidovulum sp.]